VEDGFVSIVGRVKRFAKVAGEMVSLEMVERAANLAAPASMHGVSTQPDGSRGEAIVLFTTDTGLTREALINSARKLACRRLRSP